MNGTGVVEAGTSWLVDKVCNVWLRSQEDARFTVYEDEREVIVTYVSTAAFKGNHIKAN